MFDLDGVNSKKKIAKQTRESKFDAFLANIQFVNWQMVDELVTLQQFIFRSNYEIYEFLIIRLQTRFILSYLYVFVECVIYKS